MIYKNKLTKETLSQIIDEINKNEYHYFYLDNLDTDNELLFEVLRKSFRGTLLFHYKEGFLKELFSSSEKILDYLFYEIKEEIISALKFKKYQAFYQIIAAYSTSTVQDYIFDLPNIEDYLYLVEEFFGSNKKLLYSVPKHFSLNVIFTLEDLTKLKKELISSASAVFSSQILTKLGNYKLYDIAHSAPRIIKDLYKFLCEDKKVREQLEKNKIPPKPFSYVNSSLESEDLAYKINFVLDISDFVTENTLDNIYEALKALFINNRKLLSLYRLDFRDYFLSKVEENKKEFLLYHGVRDDSYFYYNIAHALSVLFYVYFYGVFVKDFKPFLNNQIFYLPLLSIKDDLISTLSFYNIPIFTGFTFR